ncbi:nicotinate-nucleotide adenylyltransferase [bacterium]|nr:nicotinate-nucleotide adenylyltransferase [bacterium]
MQKRAIGILGGTFNPVHFGHLHAAARAREALSLDEVIFIPSALPPHKPSNGASGAHRMAMVRLAIKDEPAFSASDIEIARGGSSYTFDTLTQLAAARPDARFVFLLGTDAWREIGTWYRFPEVLRLADWGVLRRPGGPMEPLAVSLGVAADTFSMDADGALADRSTGAWIRLVEIPPLDVSSTHVRERIRRGAPIGDLVPAAVAAYIETHGLYRGESRA